MNCPRTKPRRLSPRWFLWCKGCLELIVVDKNIPTRKSIWEREISNDKLLMKLLLEIPIYLPAMTNNNKTEHKTLILAMIPFSTWSKKSISIFISPWIEMKHFNVKGTKTYSSHSLISWKCFGWICWTYNMLKGKGRACWVHLVGEREKFLLYYLNKLE